MREDEGRSRRSLWVGPVVGVVAVAFRVGVEAHSVGWGVVAGAACVAVIGSLVVFVRRRAEGRLASVATGSLTVDATLDFSCLPGEWPAMARETLGPLSGNRLSGMGVQLTASDGYLTVERRKLPMTGKFPFTARVPLRSIREVSVGRSRRTLSGCSLTFALGSGDELRVDVPVGSESAERVADHFRDSAGNAPPDSSRWGALEVTSPLPPRRTSPARAGLLTMAFFPPWSVAMVGFHNGVIAGVTLSVGLFLALGLVLFRPVWMTSVLLWAMALGGVAFAVDALRFGRPLRLGGTAVCALLATWMARRSSAPAMPSPFGPDLF